MGVFGLIDYVISLKKISEKFTNILEIILVYYPECSRPIPMLKEFFQYQNLNKGRC